MTRKDYVALAAALKAAMPSGELAFHREFKQWMHDCKHVADALQRDNARFDRERFLTACGIED